MARASAQSKRIGRPSVAPKLRQQMFLRRLGLRYAYTMAANCFDPPLAIYRIIGDKLVKAPSAGRLPRSCARRKYRFADAVGQDREQDSV